MKKTVLMIAALTATLCAGLSACGGSPAPAPAPAPAAQETSSPEEESAETPALTEDATTEASGESRTEEWGKFSVLVPAGFEFSGGDVLDETDTRYFSVKKCFFSSFDFKTEETDENMTASYNYNKETYTNGQKPETSGTFGSLEWTGFDYDGAGTPCFELYGKIEGINVRVSGIGFTLSDSETKEVLGSLALKASDEAETADSGEAAGAEAEEETAAGTEEAAVNYIQVVEMDHVRAGIPEGYTVIKDAAPKQFIFKNVETGGQIGYWCGKDTADEQIQKSLNTLENVEKQEWDIGGVHWVGYIPYEGGYDLACDTTAGYFMIDMEYGTMEELEKLIAGLEMDLPDIP